MNFWDRIIYAFERGFSKTITTETNTWTLVDQEPFSDDAGWTFVPTIITITKKNNKFSFMIIDGYSTEFTGMRIETRIDKSRNIPTRFLKYLDRK